MKKLLTAIDASGDGLKVVDYVGQQFSGMGDLRIILFHVLPTVVPELRDDGHILPEGEKRERKVVLDKWQANQILKLEPPFRSAVETLTQSGIRPDQIETKSTSESVTNIPDCIVSEARTGGYQTLVVGRCSRHSRARHALLGNTANTVINRGAGIAICVVE
jgi:nucleotide-binding universal stress UspA family protein